MDEGREAGGRGTRMSPGRTARIWDQTEAF